MSALPLDLYFVTFNCGRALLDVEAFASSLFHSRPKQDALPDLVVLSLQEVAPIAYSFLGGAILQQYFTPFLAAVFRAGGRQAEYGHLITHNVGMTAIMVLARAEVLPNIAWMQTAEVGVGWSEMGNKGAAAVRIGYRSDAMEGSVPLTFVAAHLAPAEDAWERRNEDWKNIVQKLTFKSSDTSTASLSTTSPKLRGAASDEAEPLLSDSAKEISTKDGLTGIFIPGSPVFFAGDLNYRTCDTGPRSDDQNLFPQPVSSKEHPQHWTRLFPQDQLNRERQAGKTLHGLEEAPVTFPPTYKFSEKQQESMLRNQFLTEDQRVEEWHWSSHRFPSWCDRILFSAALTSSKALHGVSYNVSPIQPTSDHRPVALSCQLDVQKASQALSSQISPYELSTSALEERYAARRREAAVGMLSYLGWTYEGNGLTLASVFGVVGGWWILTSLMRT